jgi:hypothetical protein
MAAAAVVPRSEGMTTRSKTANLRKVVKDVIERKEEEEKAAPLSTAEDERMISEGEYDAIINENIQIAAGLLVLADKSSGRDDDRSTDEMKMIADIVHDMSKLKTKNRAERKKAKDEIIHAITNAAKTIREENAAEIKEKQRKLKEQSVARVVAIRGMAHGESTGSSVASGIMDERFNKQLNDAKKIIREKRAILLNQIREVRGDQYDTDIRMSQGQEMDEITENLKSLNISGSESESEGRRINKRSSRIKRINKRNKKTRKHRKTK